LSYARYVLRDYQTPAHIRALGAKLEAVERGEIRRLMVMMPPRHGKSMLASQIFPCWYLGRHPDAQVAQSGYSRDITLEHSRRARDIFSSPETRRVFPSVRHQPQREAQEQVAIERQAAHEWGTKQGGRYYAVGVQGGLTGRGAALAIIDDPVKDREEANSRIVRDKVWAWYRSTLYPRLTPTGAIILVMTRWHPDDLAGRLIAEMNSGDGDAWDILSLPAIDIDGSALWPDRWGLAELERIEATIGPYEWAALYQQRPRPEGGSIFLRDWWAGKNRYDSTDAGMYNACYARWLSLDTAFEDKASSDYTACSVVELQPDYRIALREVYRERLLFPDLVPWTRQLVQRHNRDEKLHGIIIEDKGSGKSLVQTLRETMPDDLAALLSAYNPVGSKAVRGHGASSWCANGSVLLPHPHASIPWLPAFEQELFDFRGDDKDGHDDQVDSFTQCVLFLEHFLAEGLDARMGIAQ